jgi:hypothetical protein
MQENQLSRPGSRRGFSGISAAIKIVLVLFQGIG